MRQKITFLDGAVAIILFLIPLILFFPQTVGGKTLVPVDNLYQFEPYAALADEVGVGQPHNGLISDLILQNVAWKQFTVAQVEAGEIPLWQSNIVGGAPFIAAGQSSALYPFSAIFLVMPILNAFGWFIVSQLWIAGLAMAALARVLGLKRGPALIAALIYQLSGFTLVSVTFPMIIATMCWLPLILAMVELTIRQAPALGGTPASLPWMAGGAVFTGLATLAGHAEALYFTLLVAGFYAAFRLVALLVAERDIKHVGMRGVWLLGLVAIGLALGAVQLIPAAELVSRSFREGSESLATILTYGYPERRMLAFLMPNFFGNPAHHSYLDVFTGERLLLTTNFYGDSITNTSWGIKNYVEGGAYLSILGMTLAGVAVVQWVRQRTAYLGLESAARPYRLMLMVLSGLSLTFIFGTPTYALLYYGLPFINQSHSPFRWVWPLTLCVALLAGFGAQAVQQGERNGTLRGFMIAAFGAGGVGVLGLIGSRLFYSRIEGTVQRVFEGLALAPTAFPDGRAFYSYQFVNASILALMLLLTGGVLLLALKRTRIPVPRVGQVPAWLIAAPLIIAVDLAVATWGFYPTNDPALFDHEPEAIAWLKAQTDPLAPWRFMAFEQPGRDTMNSNIGWLHGLEDASGYDSLIPGQYAAYMQVIQPQTDLLYNRIAPLYASAPTAIESPALDLLNVRYIVSETEIGSPRFEEVYRDEAVLIYQNIGALPRAFTLPYAAAFAADDFSDTVSQYDPRLTLMLSDGPADLSAQPEQGTPQPASITVNTPNDTWVDVDLNERNWLVIAENNFPGWRAFVRPLGGDDGTEEEIPVYTVNGTFKGVALDEGQWTVRFSYAPDSFRFGAFISFMAGMALTFTAAVYVWRYAYRESSEDSAARRIAKNSITPIILNLFNRGIQFAFAIVYLRLLGPVWSGQYQYAVLIFGWFDILSNFGLDTLLMREVSRDKESANKWLVNTTIIRLGIAIAGIPVLMGFIAGREALVGDPLPDQTIAAMWLLYIGLFISTINKGLTGLFYAYEKAEYPAATQTISTMLVASLGMIALLSGFGIVGLAGVSIIVNLITLIMLGWLTVRQFFVPRFVFNWPLQREAMGESFPLMVNHLLATLFFRIDIILLEALTSDIVVGWYGVVYKWIDAINVIPAFFTQALFPLMSRQAADDLEGLRRSYRFAIKLLTLISLPVAVLTTLLAHLLIGLLAGPQYLPFSAIALQIFVWSIPLGWINSVTNYVIIALNKQRILTWAFVFGALFNIGGNLYFIPRYNFPAAAAMTILSEFVLLAFFYMVMLKPFGRVNWVATLGRIVLAAAVMAGTAYAFNRFVGLWAALPASLLVYGVAVWALKPFDAFERQQIAEILPAPISARLFK